MWANFKDSRNGKDTSTEHHHKRIMENKMKIEIWSDIMCPFCYIGKRNLENALSQFPEREKIAIEWKSFQLDPSLPEVPEHQDDINRFIAVRKGFSYEQSQKIHHELAQYAKTVGLAYNFDKALITNSTKAHRIIQFAKTRGLGEKAEELFFKAYFTDGKNVSDDATLIALGNDIGLSEGDVNEALSNPLYLQRMQQDIIEAQNLGAKGVPFFVINRKYAIAGAQQPNEILKSIENVFAEWKKENPGALTIKEGQSCTPNGACH
jgi:protein disulfide-isomerase